MAKDLYFWDFSGFCCPVYGSGLYQSWSLHFHEEYRVGIALVLGGLLKYLPLRRDLSRYVFAKQCAIRIDKQQKERYNNVVIDNDVII